MVLHCKIISKGGISLVKDHVCLYFLHTKHKTCKTLHFYLLFYNDMQLIEIL